MLDVFWQYKKVIRVQFEFVAPKWKCTYYCTVSENISNVAWYGMSSERHPIVLKVEILMYWLEQPGPIIAIIGF